MKITKFNNIPSTTDITIYVTGADAELALTSTNF